MKTSWIVAALSSISAVITLPANAVPIELSFSGTVASIITWPSGPSGYEDWVGQAFTATYLIETDALQRATESTDRYEQISYAGPSPQAMSGSLSIDGLNIDLTPYPSNSGSIYFLDTKGLIQNDDGSASGYPDQLWMSVVSTTFPSSWATEGHFFSRSLYFNTVDWADDSPLGSLLSDFIDFSRDAYEPDILLTQPFATSTLSFDNIEVACENSLCLPYGGSSVKLKFDTVTRRVMSVPEPTTLMLMSFGLLGTAVARRRRKS
jgi:hypothetical protein